MAENTKMYVAPDGGLTIVDPTITTLPLIRKLNPDFSIQSAPPPSGFVPNIQKLRQSYITGISQQELRSLPDEALWDLHDRILAQDLRPGSQGTVNLLDAKVELARREITHCRLCGWECGVNRFVTPGRCQLKEEAYYTPPFIHIAEEGPINPAATIKLYGCGMRCLYCQTWEILPVAKGRLEGKKLDQTVWSDLGKTPGFRDAASLEWAGGSPDENVYSILKALRFAPHLNIPIVWNCHLYASGTALKLLRGVVDVYLGDMKYGNDQCGQSLSGVPRYWEYTKGGLQAMVTHRARIIIRILVLPGHFDCCHLPIIRFLAPYRKRLWVSILDQYTPDFKAVSCPGMDRRPTTVEIKKVRGAIRAYGLCDVADRPDLFWREDK